MSAARIERPWARGAEEVAAELGVDPDRGLGREEAERRLAERGENRITRLRRITFWSILKEELTEPLILVLMAIGVLYSVWGKLGDTVAIIAVILAVSFAEVFTEYRAKKSIEALKRLAEPETWVMRGGSGAEVATTSLVPGDILILKAGVRVGADARIIECRGLEADESQLTGESVGATKSAAVVGADAALGDRSSMLYMGSVVLRGKGTAAVVATGMGTELGRIAGLADEARDPKTPLQEAMKQLSKDLVWIAVALSLLIPAVGLLRGQPLKDMLLSGLSLAFATIPEEMPIIVTMLLGLGSILLSKKGVLIRRTKAAETLGSVTIIATDKTGTLTENRMSIALVAARGGGKGEAELFEAAALMADLAQGGDGSFLGDPMDRAELERASELGIGRDKLLRDYELAEEEPFDEERKLFSSTWLRRGASGAGELRLVKGAAESVLALSAPDPAMEEALAAAQAAGYRTIAFARSSIAPDASAPGGAPYETLGLIAFDDPLRPEVPSAVAACAAAGVRVVMITGDHAATALRVAREAGIEASSALSGPELAAMDDAALRGAVRRASVFARITPEAKLRIVEALRANGEVVAVTGDGVNDAPALRAADIGVSMGLSGSDVAKEAADMVLAEDSFSPIPCAIAEGRRIYDNLAKCVKYYLACKIALVLSCLACVLIGRPMPFSPVQIIILELFMDLAATTSFVAEKAEAGLLERGPRGRDRGFMDGAMLAGIFGGGASLAAIVLAVFLGSLGAGAALELAQTRAFVAWLSGHVFLAFAMRTAVAPLRETGLLSSRPFNLWMLGVALFLALSLSIPTLRDYLRLASIGPAAVLLLALASFLGLSWIEIAKRLRWRRRKTAEAQAKGGRGSEEAA